MTQDNQDPALQDHQEGFKAPLSPSDATVLRRLAAILRHGAEPLPDRLVALAVRLEAEERERQDPAAMLTREEPELVQGLTFYGVDGVAAQLRDGDLLLIPGQSPLEAGGGAGWAPAPLLCRYNVEGLWRLLEAARLRGVITPRPVVGPAL